MEFCLAMDQSLMQRRGSVSANQKKMCNSKLVQINAGRKVTRKRKELCNDPVLLLVLVFLLLLVLHYLCPQFPPLIHIPPLGPLTLIHSLPPLQLPNPPSPTHSPEPPSRTPSFPSHNHTSLRLSTIIFFRRKNKIAQLNYFLTTC